MVKTKVKGEMRHRHRVGNGRASVRCRSIGTDLSGNSGQVCEQGYQQIVIFQSKRGSAPSGLFEIDRALGGADHGRRTESGHTAETVLWETSAANGAAAWYSPRAEVLLPAVL